MNTLDKILNSLEVLIDGHPAPVERCGCNDCITWLNLIEKSM